MDNDQFGRWRGPIPMRDRYRIGIERRSEERAEVAGSVIGVLILVAICFVVPALLHALFRI